MGQISSHNLRMPARTKLANPYCADQHLFGGGGLVQQGLFAAFEVVAHDRHRGSADKRYSLKHMNRSVVLAVVEVSLSRPTGTPNTSNLPRDVFIEEEKVKLRASLIDPIRVLAYPSEWAIEQCGLKDEVYDFVAVASEGDGGIYWLLLDPATNNFYKACRSDEGDAKMYLLGYHSDDAPTEWRG